MASDSLGVSRFISERAHRMRESRPDTAIWELRGEEDGLAKVGMPHWPEGRSVSIPSQINVSGKAGAGARIAFHGGSLQNPYVVGLLPGVGKAVKTDGGPTLSDWLYALGGPGLGRSAISALPNLEATPSTVWTGTGRFDAYPLGVLSLAAGAKILTAQLLRNEDDDAWEKLRLHVIGTDAEELDVNLTESPTLAFGYNQMWSNASGDLVFVCLDPAVQLYRRRFGLFEALTLSDNSGGSFAGMNVLSGVVGLGRHVRTIPTSTAGPGWVSGPLTVTYGSDGSASGGYVEAWLCDVSGTTIARAWQVTPNDILGLSNPVLLSWELGRLTGSGSNFIGCCMGREALHLGPGVADYDLGLCVGFLNGPTSDSSVLSTQGTFYSRLAKASVFAVGATTGTVAWQYDVEATPSAPIEDEGLLQPLEDFLEANLPSSTSTPAYSLEFGGRHSQLDTLVSTSESGGAVGDTISANYPNINDASPTFQAPDFEVLVNSGVLWLPLANGNQTMPTKVDTVWRTTEVFTKWPYRMESPLSNSAEFPKDADGNVYGAFLRPKGLLLGGRFSMDVGVTLGLVEPGCDSYNNLALGTISSIVPGDEDTPTVVTVTAKFLPGLAQVGERFLVKLSPEGALLGLKDITQKVTAAWYRTPGELLTGATGAVVGGESTNPIELADNVWQRSAAGRCLFSIEDYHDLGAGYRPCPKLMIRNTSDDSLDLLHEANLRFADTLLSSDIYQGVDATDSYPLDGLTDTFTLSFEALGIDEVRVNGTPTSSWTWSSGDPQTLNLTDFFADGDSLDVDYTTRGDLIYRANDRKYELLGSGCELRTGLSGSLEWAIVLTTQTDRTTGSTTPWAVVVEMASNLATTPTITGISFLHSAAYSIAISNGHLLQIEYSGGAWKIVSV